MALLASLALAPAAVTYQSTATDGSDLSTYTFSAQAIGAASANRYVICGFGARYTSGTPTITSVTIGGVAATQVSAQLAGTGTGKLLAGLYIALVPTGTTADIVIAFSATALRCDHVTFSATGLQSATPTASVMSTANPGTSGSFSVSAGWIIVAFAMILGNASGRTCTWANLTERSDNVSSDWDVYTGAADAFANASTQTITATPSAGIDTMNFHCAAFR
jgi:hypothetical protein